MVLFGCVMVVMLRGTKPVGNGGGVVVSCGVECGGGVDRLGCFGGGGALDLRHVGLVVVVLLVGAVGGDL